MNAYFHSLLQPIKRRIVKLESEPINSVFNKKFNISNELAKFLGVHPSLMLSRIEITRALCIYIHKSKISIDGSRSRKWFYLNKVNRDLRNPNNLKNIVPDEKLSSLLDYEQYKKNVMAGKIRLPNIVNWKKAGQTKTDPELKYSTLQILVSKHFIK
jgi:chromatin remodeling complex protein RSC6